MAGYSRGGWHRNVDSPGGAGGSYIDQHPGKSILHGDSFSSDDNDNIISVFIVFVFILELLILVFAAVLEYFLRYTDVFPVRHLNFSCSDPDISFQPEEERSTYDDFAHDADVPDDLVVALSFCVPVFIIVVGEISLWVFTESEQKTLRVLCRQCKMPQIIRRIIRYTGAFLFGLLLTMIFADVAKIMTGELRPNFLEICKPNMTICTGGGLYDENICMESDVDKLRDARLSFPSMHASMTSFAASFLAIYLHNIIRAHSVWLLRPFVSLGCIMLSIMAGLVRYGLHYSHWYDILAGWILGLIVAIYITVFVLNNFREYLTGRKLYMHVQNLLAAQHARDLREFYKNDPLDYYSYFGIPAYNSAAVDAYTFNNGAGVPLPRPHPRPGVGVSGYSPGAQLTMLGQHSPGTESSTDHGHIELISDNREHPTEAEMNVLRKYQAPDTFQRDLARTLGNYRRPDIHYDTSPHRLPYGTTGHM